MYMQMVGKTHPFSGTALKLCYSASAPAGCPAQSIYEQYKYLPQVMASSQYYFKLCCSVLMCFPTCTLYMQILVCLERVCTQHVVWASSVQTQHCSTQQLIMYMYVITPPYTHTQMYAAVLSFGIIRCMAGRQLCYVEYSDIWVGDKIWEKKMVEQIEQEREHST